MVVRSGPWISRQRRLRPELRRRIVQYVGHLYLEGQHFDRNAADSFCSPDQRACLRSNSRVMFSENGDRVELRAVRTAGVEAACYDSPPCSRANKSLALRMFNDGCQDRSVVDSITVGKSRCALVIAGWG